MVARRGARSIMAGVTALIAELHGECMRTLCADTDFEGLTVAARHAKRCGRIQSGTAKWLEKLDVTFHVNTHISGARSRAFYARLRADLGRGAASTRSGTVSEAALVPEEVEEEEPSGAPGAEVQADAEPAKAEKSTGDSVSEEAADGAATGKGAKAERKPRRRKRGKPASDDDVLDAAIRQVQEEPVTAHVHVSRIGTCPRGHRLVEGGARPCVGTPDGLCESRVGEVAPIAAITCVSKSCGFGWCLSCAGRIHFGKPPQAP